MTIDGIQLLKTVSEKEIIAFEKYLTRLYPRKKQHHQLLAYYKDSLKKKDFEQLEKNVICEKAFPKKSITSSRLSKLNADLNNFLEEFLRYEQVKSPSNDFGYHLSMIKIYHEKGLDDCFFNQIEQAKKAVLSQPKDMWTAFKIMQLNHFAYFTTRKNKTEVNMAFFEEAQNALNDFWIGSQMKYACEASNRANILNVKHASDEIVTYFLAEYPEKVKDAFIGNLYQEVLKLVQEGEEEQFEQLLKRYTEDLPNQTTPLERLNVFIFLLNYLTKELRKNQAEEPLLARKYLTVYQNGLASKVLLADGWLDTHHFMNVVIAACNLKELEWANDFLDNYKDYLNQQERYAVEHLMKSRLLYAEGSFVAAKNRLAKLENIKDFDVVFALRARILALKSHTEASIQAKATLAPYEKHCNRFEKYLNRDHDLGAGIIEAYRNFIRMLRHIFVNYRKPECELMIQLAVFESIVQRAWLVEKIKERENLSEDFQRGFSPTIRN